MLRKHIVKAPPSHPVPEPGEMDIAATATVQVTSEDPAHPIEHVFDTRRGPGGSRWVAAEPGEQTLILAFDTPQTMHQTLVEVEELEVGRTQEFRLSVSHDGGQIYRELRSQEYNFSPPGTTLSDATKSKGMGAMPHTEGVAFRVWAPHVQRASVIGSFNDWDGNTHPMHAEANGCWYADVAEAHVGDQYRYLLTTAQDAFTRIDPYAREVTNSVGNAIVHDPSFAWEGDDFHLVPWNDLVIYELHLGTFNAEEDDHLSGQFAVVSARLGHLHKLGVNAIQVMPVAEFAGERSWGYNPSHIFSVEIDYGGPVAFKRFIKRAHEHGMAVILDVVYNHLGPSDLDLWQFDGWSENNLDSNA